MPPRFKAPALLALAGHISLISPPTQASWPSIRRRYEWPRRPLAIGRRGLPLNPVPVRPGMSSTPRLSLISADTVLSARTPFLWRVPCLRRGAEAWRASARTAQLRGISKAARPAGTGLCQLVSAPPGTSCARGPEPPHELRSAAWPQLASPRAGAAGEQSSSRCRRRSRFGLLSCTLILEGIARVPGMRASAGAVPRRSTMRALLNGQLPHERVARIADALRAARSRRLDL